LVAGRGIRELDLGGADDSAQQKQYRY